MKTYQQDAPQGPGVCRHIAKCYYVGIKNAYKIRTRTSIRYSLRQDIFPTGQLIHVGRVQAN